MALNSPNSSVTVANPISTMADNHSSNQTSTGGNSVSQSQPIFSLPSEVISNSANNQPKTLISQQPISLLPNVKTFSPYQLAFPLREDSDSDEDISEDEMFPSSSVKMETCDSSHTNCSSPVQSKPSETYIIFDPKSSTNGQVRSSRQLLMTQFITHKPDSCCSIM